MEDSPEDQAAKSQIATGILKSDQSKSSKIRELARAGFARTEIRDLLGIRYQHVRKVLVDAGIDTGYSNAATKPRAKAVKDQARSQDRQPYDWKALLKSGFSLVGEWSLDGDHISLSGDLPSEAGVYAFVLGDEVVYVGLTQNALKTRMGHYRIGHSRQKTSARVKGLIKEALTDGGRVQVLMCTPENSEWNGLPVHMGPGLEAGLIELIQPAWNIQGRSSRS